MGIWDWINYSSDSVRRNTPDLLTPAKYLYNGTTDAVKKIDDVVRVNGVQKLLADDEGRSKIASFSTKFVKNASAYALTEAYKELIPGGKAVAKIYSKTVREMEADSRKPENQKNEDKACVEEKEIANNLSKNTIGNDACILLDGRELVLGSENRVEVHSSPYQTNSRELALGSENRGQVHSSPYQTPEDAIRIFMMKEFIGTRLFDDLLVPDHGRHKKA